MNPPRRVPLVDLDRLHASIRSELDAAVESVIESSQFIGGTRRFEDAFAAAHGLEAAAGCGSGTDALALALVGLGIGEGDDVVVPAMTFVATAEAVVLAGARPVLADVDPATLLLTAAAVDAVRTPATRAVIPVHLYGRMVAPEDLMAMAASGLIVVEDAAQAHLATAGGCGVGTLSAAAAFSFHPAKNLGALGDGGAVASMDAGLVERIRSLRDHGRSGWHRHDVVGRCSRLDGLHAAVLEAKLRHLPAWTDARRERAERYRERLGDLVVPFDDGAVHHLLVIRSPERDAVAAELDAAGIGWGLHYPVALSGQPAFAPWATPCPAAEQAATTVLSLPMDPLLPLADVELVCDVVEKVLAER